MTAPRRPETRGPAWAFERGWLWAIELERTAAAGVTPRLPARLGELRREAAEPLAQAMGLPDAGPVLRRLATGRRCFGAWCSEQLVAYGWVSRVVECIGEHHREIHLAADEAYIWDCATLPAYRGRRLYSALLSRLASQLAGEGLRRLWIGTALANRPSMRGMVNAGFQPVLGLTTLRLGRLVCTWAAGQPAAPARLVAAARRALFDGRERATGPLYLMLTAPAPLPSCRQVEA